MKTLVVDDSSTIRRIIRQTLEARLECQVWEAGGGDEALAVLEAEGPFALVVTDLHMEKGSGEWLIRKLRARPGGQGVAVLVASVEPHQENGLEDLFQSGADGFLSKPFRLDELEAAARQVLARHRGASPVEETGHD